MNSVLGQILAKINAVAEAPSHTASSRGGSVESEATFRGFSDPAIQTATATDAASASGSVHSSGSHAFMRQAARKLHSLPIFSGAPEDWPKFIMRYKQTTDAYDYSDIDNSLRLQECLRGEALAAVDCMLSNSENTALVIETLEGRFGRPELLAQVQLRLVREILPIVETRAELIIPYASKVANMVSYIDQPRTRQYLDNPELLEQLVQKLPLSRRHKWGEFAVDMGAPPTIRHFSSWLTQQAKCVSMMTPAALVAAAVLPTAQARANQPTQALHNPRRERMMHIDATEPTLCSICDKRNHAATECRTFVRMNLGDRWNAARDRRLCFACLKPGHGSAHCEQRKRCGVDGCRRPHHELLHTPTTAAPRSSSSGPRENPFSRNNSSSNTQSQPTGSATASAGGGNSERVNNCTVASPISSRFRVVPVKLYGKGGPVRTLALLDDGSSATLVEEALATELGLSGPRSSLEMQWMNGRCVTEMSQRISLVISGIREEHKQYEMSHVGTVGYMDLPRQTIQMDELLRLNPDLDNLPIDEYEAERPRILIGNKHEYLIVPTREISNMEWSLGRSQRKHAWAGRFVGQTNRRCVR